MIRCYDYLKHNNFYSYKKWFSLSKKCVRISYSECLAIWPWARISNPAPGLMPTNIRLKCVRISYSEYLAIWPWARISNPAPGLMPTNIRLTLRVLPSKFLSIWCIRFATLNLAVAEWMLAEWTRGIGDISKEKEVTVNTPGLWSFSASGALPVRMDTIHSWLTYV